VPLLSEYSELIASKKGIASLVKNKTAVKFYIEDVPCLIDDCLVRALMWRIASKHFLSEQITNSNVLREYKDGFILELYFYEALAKYEKSNKNFKEYYPTIISKININYEKRRWKEK
jgi:hypothetical protein